jgi:hypothetical protein
MKSQPICLMPLAGEAFEPIQSHRVIRQTPKLRCNTVSLYQGSLVIRSFGRFEMRSFSSFPEAANHACAVAKEIGATVRVLRDGDVWVVHSPSAQSSSTQLAPVQHSSTLVASVAVQAPDSAPSPAPSPPPGPTRKLTPEEAEWEHLWSLASKAAQGVGATQRDVLDEFSRLLKKRNPLAVRAQRELIESEKDNPYRKASPGFSEGAVLFRPFSEELPFLRG